MNCRSAAVTSPKPRAGIWKVDDVEWQCFPEAMFEFQGVKASSGVADQPIGEEETLRGAIHRTNDALRRWIAENGEEAASHVQFVCGLEGGVSWERLPREVAADESSEFLQCFAWMAVYQRSSEKWGFARTGTLALPRAVSDLIKDGMELGDADDCVFGRSNSKQQDGSVGLLTNGAIDRCEYYQHALVLAMAPFLNPEYCHTDPIAGARGSSVSGE